MAQEKPEVALLTSTGIRRVRTFDMVIGNIEPFAVVHPLREKLLPTHQ